MVSKATGIPSVVKVVTDQGLANRVKVTGLGLPSQLAEYLDSGACPYMFLWNPSDLGYVSAFTSMALAHNQITGKLGDSFSAGRLGQYRVVTADDGGTEVLLGPPFKFDRSNINEWKTVY
jgi:rhamnose transport system substrate-binding protein